MTPFASRRGQATTEIVLLFPLFLFFMFAFVKIFAFLILVQKMEIASYYAARRWQLESHRNVQYSGPNGFDYGQLLADGNSGSESIQSVVQRYLGYNDAGGNPDTYMRNFFGMTGEPTVTVNETEVWNIVTLNVPITLWNNGKIGQWFHLQPLSTVMSVTKYVPNRDRPIMFRLPGG